MQGNEKSDFINSAEYLKMTAIFSAWDNDINDSFYVLCAGLIGLPHFDVPSENKKASG